MTNWDIFFRKALTRYVEAAEKRQKGPKSNNKRQRLGKKEEDRVYNFYGRECIICGLDHGLDMGHINEDRSDKHFANLIPLCSNANQAIDRDDYKTQKGLVGEVRPSNIREQAREHFRKGNYPRAYGCNTLLAYLYESRPHDLTSAVESLVFSIAALRPLGHHRHHYYHRELLVDTVAHCVYLFKAADHNMSAFWKAEILSQVGLVLYDFGAPQEARECESKALELYNRLSGSDHPETREERKARGLKREALVWGPFPTTKRKLQAFDSINESKEIAGKTRDSQAFVSASWVEATLKYSLGQVKPSLDIVEEALILKAKADKWTLEGLHIQAARAYQQLKGKREIVIEHYQSAYDICIEHKTTPIPLPFNGDLIVPDPGSELRSLGRNEFGLILPRKANPFTSSIIETLFRVIEGK